MLCYRRGKLTPSSFLLSLPSFEQNINNFFDRLWKRGSLGKRGGNKTIPSIFGGERGIQTTISTGLLSRTAMTAINGPRDVLTLRAFHNFDCKVAWRFVPVGWLFWLSIVIAILFDRTVER
ncbi:hypothetical protein CEXT_722401 [Caerostris extrusa]|uniref:Uncharacterized protein n=1 Tax=Caerostris extrusa TaxID=172846 RepID=A0AAV4TPZ0_CAEEX|nr:hypothetical protein CEXT_722401 [Caerostris extrusa]